MHTESTERQLRLNLVSDVSNQKQRPANVIAMDTNLQMSGKNCKNNQQQQQNRERRRQRGFGARQGHKQTAAVVEGVGKNFATFWCINLIILICLAHCTKAVPTDSGSSSSNNNINSASSTIVMVAVTPSSISSSSISFATSTFSSTTDSQLEQQHPQGQCLLDGLWVPETTVHCEKQASCRAIQRTGHCCPDYKCDCEKDGKTYANGYKLVDPDTPCVVCYCKGGEIVCSPVTCFRRDDCKPKYVTGRCCPEYDNCPILDNNPLLASETSSMMPPTTKAAPLTPPAGFNWNITIKEITKPTEIRITDDNPKFKQAIPTRKVHSTEAPTASTTAAATTTPTTLAAAATITAPAEADSTASTTTAATAIATTEAPTASTAATVGISTTAAAVAIAMPATVTDMPATPMKSSSLSQDTNQKALPVNSSESLKLIASVGYIERPLDQNNMLGQKQQKPLVTYNADGLQALAENDPSKVNIKREYTTEGVIGLLSKQAESVPIGAASTFLQNEYRDALVDNIAAADLEPDTAGSDNIYHIISTSEGPNSGSSTTEQQLTDGPMLINEFSSSFGYENGTAGVDPSTEGLLAVSSSESPLASSTGHTVHHMDDEDVPQIESNPAYPSLPEDDFSLRDVNFPLVELEDIAESDTKDEQRSIVNPFERDNKRTKLVTERNLDASGGGSGDLELIPALASTTEVTQAEVFNPKGATTSQVPLMYSVEESSAETRIQNVSDLSKFSRNQSENETSGELESGSGSGGSDLREPTTPKTISVPVLDIDELGSGSGAGQAQGTGQDPKADAESLKLDESREQSDNAAKTNDADKTTSRVEKSFEEQVTGLRLEQPIERLYLQRIY